MLHLRTVFCLICTLARAGILSLRQGQNNTRFVLPLPTFISTTAFLRFESLQAAEQSPHAGLSRPSRGRQVSVITSRRRRKQIQPLPERLDLGDRALSTCDFRHHQIWTSHDCEVSTRPIISIMAPSTCLPLKSWPPYCGGFKHAASRKSDRSPRQGSSRCALVNATQGELKRRPTASIPLDHLNLLSWKIDLKEHKAKGSAPLEAGLGRGEPLAVLPIGCPYRLQESTWLVTLCLRGLTRFLEVLVGPGDDY